MHTIPTFFSYVYVGRCTFLLYYKLAGIHFKKVGEHLNHVRDMKP